MLDLQPKQWHNDTFVVGVKGKTFTCKLRQNPLAEYIILQEEEEEVLAYQLVQEHRQTAVRIRRNPNRLDEPLLELHLLLWYLFLPLSQHATGEQQLQWLGLAS